MKVDTSERIPIKMWLNEIEEGAFSQAKNLAKLPFAFKWIVIMPDSHQGYGMPIGGVLATKGVIIPNAVGVDIGCGMCAVKTSLTEIGEDALKLVMGNVRKVIPVGFTHHQKPQEWEGFDRAPKIGIIMEELYSARKQIGTLGGGNHFIEFQKDEEENIWAMVHSGSRNFGFKTAKIYHDLAKRLCERWNIPLPDPDLAYLPMSDIAGQEYHKAMSFCLEFAQANRALMMRRIMEILNVATGAVPLSEVNIHHNYAALENHYGVDVWVHRKGAIRARKGEFGIIPGSMGSSSYIVSGLGNPMSFCSSSHGAGRRMGRKEAQRSLKLDEEVAKMEGIVHGLRGKKNLDEAPGAYKDIDEVMENQKDLTNILVCLHPIGSIKG